MATVDQVVFANKRYGVHVEEIERVALILSLATQRIMRPVNGYIRQWTPQKQNLSSGDVDLSCKRVNDPAVLRSSNASPTTRCQTDLY